MTVALQFEDSAVVELRRYTLRPGRRSDLLQVFGRHLVEPQEAAGMAVGGTFIDEDDPDCFTWLRGFRDQDARLRALTSFYGGPVWAQHRDAANATMVDSDDVVMLRATSPAHGPASAVERGEVDDPPRPERVLLGVDELTTDADAAERWFADDGVAALEEVLGVRVAAWRTDPTPNAFPRLPVRDERVLVWLAVFPQGSARDDAAARLAAVRPDRDLGGRSPRRHTFRLSPTARSAHPAALPPVRRDPSSGVSV